MTTNAATERRLRKGDEVAIFNNMFTGKPVIEGRAKLTRLIEDGPHGQLWRVQFTDGHVCDRFVLPDAQDDPQAELRRQQAEWTNHNGSAA
jgi:hypothetical protein